MTMLEPRLIFLAIMPFTLLTPVIAIALLPKNNEIPVNSWYMGCLCIAGAYLLIGLRAILPFWVGYYLAQLMLVIGICMLMACFRENLLLNPRWGLFIGIVIFYIAIFSILLHFNFDVLRQLFVNIFNIVLTGWLLINSNTLEKVHHSVGLKLCAIGFLMTALGSFIRIIGLTFELGSKNPLEPSWDNVLLILSLLMGTLLINYGYFGYVMERIRDQTKKTKSELKSLKIECDQANLREQTLEELIKERDQLITVMAQTNRHAILDLMSASISHEINQPLSAVTLNLSVLDSFIHSSSTDNQVSDIMQSVVADIERIKNVIKQVRALSSSQCLEFEPVLLKEALNAACNLSKYEYQENNIMLIMEDIDDDLWVQGNRVLLVQVFLNLLLNAIHAIVIKNRGSRWIKISSRSSVDFAWVFIEDSGPGISPEVLNRIFEVFQTTREDGLGLGLPLCQAIIQRFGGDISLKTEQGEGVIVSLKLKVA